MKKTLLTFIAGFSFLFAHATIHEIEVVDANMSFNPNFIQIQLGDTIHWVPSATPSLFHTITSVTIPDGAEGFDYQWQPPSQVFFEYIPQVAGLYGYICEPHIQMQMAGGIEVIGSSGIEDPSAEIAPVLFPNPASEILTLSNFHEGPTSYVIYSITGGVAQSGVLTSAIGIAGLKKGYYILEVHGMEQRIYKFIKD